MKVKKGAKLIINDNRKGRYKAEAYDDFETEVDEWYPVITLEEVVGLNNYWLPGEKIPCRRGLAEVSIEE